MVTISVFCETCGRYLGIESFCQECKQERPYIKQVAQQPGRPLQTLPVSHLDSGQLQYWGDSWLIQVGRRGYIHAFHLETGQHLWSYNTGQSLRTRLVKRGSRLYATSRRGNMVLAFDITPQGASEVWRYRLSGAGGSLTGYRDMLYLGDGEGHCYALRDLGAEAELHWAAPANLGQFVSAAPVRWRSFLLVATHHASRGRLAALNADRGGDVVWDEPIGDRVRLAPVVVENHLFLVTDGGELYLFGLLQDGRLMPGFPQKLPDGVSAPLLVADDTVYLGLRNGRVLAVTATEGTISQVTRLGDQPIRSLAYWQGLLFAADNGGQLKAIEADTKKAAWSWAAGSPLRAGLVAAQGQVIVGQTGKLTTLPWHLGQWSWAAGWSKRREHFEAAAASYALNGQREEAAAQWMSIDKPRLAGQLWAGFPDKDREAAEAFQKAARREESMRPTAVSGLWVRAAHHFELAKMTKEANECRYKAGRTGRFAYLVIESFNLPVFEEGQPGQIAVWVRNLGNDTAQNVRLWLEGGRGIVEESISSLAKGELRSITFDNVIPGSQDFTLSVSLVYEGGAHHQNFTQTEWAIQVTPPKPGAIAVDGDVGAIIVRIPEGAERPSVRVNQGMVGLVKYEIQPGIHLTSAMDTRDPLPTSSKQVDRIGHATVTASLPQRLLGKYELLGLIQEGGMGAVYKARDYSTPDPRPVAIKLLAPNRQQDPQFQERFEQEVRLISLLEHPAILPIYDYGLVNDLPILVMRYAAGGTLQAKIADEGPLSPAVSVKLLQTIASGLDKAHSKGIIHRDIKGANILLDEDDNPYLADFGIARSIDMDNTTTDIGTPPYMAPEQWRREPITAQTDVYQLGVLLFEMLTGERPFRQLSRKDYKHDHLKVEVPFVHKINPALSPYYDTVIRKAMAKNPNERYPTAGALASALAAVKAKAEKES